MTAPYDKVVDIDRLGVFLGNLDNRFAPKSASSKGFYLGGCATPASTAVKAVTVNDASFALRSGVAIMVTFSRPIYTTLDGTYAFSGLNVNSTGTKAVKILGGCTVGGYTGRFFFTDINAQSLLFVYDGTNWVYIPGVTFLSGNVSTSASEQTKMFNYGAFPPVHEGFLISATWANGNTANNPTLYFSNLVGTGVSYPILDTSGNALTTASPDNPSAGDVTLMRFTGDTGWRIVGTFAAGGGESGGGDTVLYGGNALDLFNVLGDPQYNARRVALPDGTTRVRVEGWVWHSAASNVCRFDFIMNPFANASQWSARDNSNVHSIPIRFLNSGTKYTYILDVTANALPEASASTDVINPDFFDGHTRTLQISCNGTSGQVIPDAAVVPGQMQVALTRVTALA